MQLTDFAILGCIRHSSNNVWNFDIVVPSSLIALSNSAPYLKNLSISATARLMQLFNSFSNPLFLLSDESHPRLLFFMCVGLLIFQPNLLNHDNLLGWKYSVR